MGEIKVGKLAITLPEIPVSERTQTVEALLVVIEQLAQIIQFQASRITVLEDEVARLKGQKPRPRIEPSSLSREPQVNQNESGGKRPGSEKRSKTRALKIHRTIRLKPENLPAGSKFKGYQDYVAQDLRLELYNTRYLRGVWQTPDGKRIVAELPAALNGTHFGPTVTSYVVSLSAQLRVPQPLIREHLLELGVDISAGQIDRMLSNWGKTLAPERDDLLRAGLKVAPYIQVDDTGARHRGKNGVCTQIGGDFFTFFASTGSKSRINFIELLQAGNHGFLLNEISREYLQGLGVKPSVLAPLPWGSEFADKKTWQGYLATRNTKYRERELTESALLGYAVKHGLRKDLLVLSDDAGQFNIFSHALCWYHAERPLVKLIPLTPENCADLEQVRSEFWGLYRALKQFQLEPTAKQSEILLARFEALVSRKTSFQSLNLVLDRIRTNQAELLRVLSHPCLPLHNNGSEREIREYVTRRKISAGTRSDAGRLSRDTMLSLKKTLRKLGISFWQFIQDRVSASRLIPPVANLVSARYLAAQSP